MLPCLIQDAARELWNVAVHLLGSPAARALVFVPLRATLQELTRAGVREELPLRVTMLATLFECFKDRCEWAAGLNAVDEAFQVVPQALQKRLWEFRVVFSSKVCMCA